MKRRLCVCAIVIVAVGIWLFWGRARESQNFSETAVPALPAISPSPFLNTSGDATYVGRETCAQCHPEIHRDYEATAHRHAFGEVLLPDTPEDAEFFSSATGRWYRSFRKDGGLWHRESLRLPGGEELILSEYPLRWMIGSGRFSKSYLVEEEGFLIQSPLTWYRSRPGWDLSPGYKEHNSSFQRTAELRCILCHVGRAEPIGGSYHRLAIHTEAIDCERCHGPGSVHAARRSEGSVEGADFSIVHPGRLDRGGVEAICSQCHLHGAAMIELRGRRLSDFRPGLPLADFAVPYGLESPRQTMQVVGHMEQMRLSPCYQASESLTCTTCHNPHQKLDQAEHLSHYRAICLNCHEPQSCGVPEAKRLMLQSDDDCVSCHMPKSPTEIPHFAFTHHRIGIHDSPDGPSGFSEPQRLVPLADVSHLPPIDQDRNLGLAYMQVADLAEHLQHAEIYHDRARRLLERVRERGLEDPAVDAALARLYWQRDGLRTILFAESVLASGSATPDERSTALFTLATTEFDRGNITKAVPLLEELVTVRRYSDAWSLLSLCREQQGDLEGALAAAVRAAEISPVRLDYQERLVYLYRRTGRPEMARTHQERLQFLREFLEQGS